MAISSIQVSLLIGQGVPIPAPAALLSALDSISITQSSDTSGFQITFRAERSAGYSVDYALLSGPLLQPGARIIITATIAAVPRVLMDGLVTHYQLAPESNGTTTLTITGEDVSVAMSLMEVALEYPALGDMAIVALVIAKYAMYGLIPLVIPPLSNPISLPMEEVPQQSGNDRDYVRGLAARHGYVFVVKPGPTPGTNIAYWGPIERIGIPQKALSINLGPATNVESLSFSYNSLAPEQIYGAVSDKDAELILPVLTVTSLQLQPLASRPPLIFNQPFVRKSMLDYQGSSWIEAQAYAQSRTNRSTEDAVTAEGSLDVLRYGDVLTAPGIVGVRGAGYSYDGNYYVKSVTHDIRVGQYKQTFSLAREGTGSLTTGVQP